jgi:hypothetical protein
MRIYLEQRCDVGICPSTSGVDVSVQISGTSSLTGDISQGLAECLKFSETLTRPSPLSRSPPPQAPFLQFGVPPPQPPLVHFVQPGQPIFAAGSPSPSPSPGFQCCGWEIFDRTVADIRRKRAISFSEIYGPSSRETSVTLSLIFRIKVDIHSRDSFLIEQ